MGTDILVVGEKKCVSHWKIFHPHFQWWKANGWDLRGHSLHTQIRWDFRRAGIEWHLRSQPSLRKSGFFTGKSSVRKEISLSSLKMILENPNLKEDRPSHNPMASYLHPPRVKVHQGM